MVRQRGADHVSPAENASSLNFPLCLSRACLGKAFAGYIQQRRNDYQGWMTAMLTGLSHYSEMYAAKWGAGLISMEVGAGIANTQSKIVSSAYMPMPDLSPGINSTRHILIPC
eukprot:COSAG06_NODE_2215_length_7325_cov_5.038887_12_plen_113_part_00